LGILEHFNAAGRTPLMLAANASNVPMVQALLAFHVNPMAECFGHQPGRTARDFAFGGGGNRDVMGMLQVAMDRVNPLA
jgi:ankyrin repeat protein